MKKSEIREMIVEEILKESHWRPEDNILDDITFEELMTTLESNEKTIDEKSITKVFNELMKSKVSEAKYTFKKNMGKILSFMDAENL